MGGRRGANGLTMIELMVVVAVVVVLMLVAAPSFKRFIDVQRLRSINSQLITDIQFARAEAASRNRKVVVKFEQVGSNNCYTLLTGNPDLCNCSLTPGDNICQGSGQREIRTVQVPSGTSITLGVPATQEARSMQFNPATGRIETAASDIFDEPDGVFVIQVSHSAVGGFKTSVEPTGRPTTCSPSGQISGVPACSP